VGRCQETTDALSQIRLQKKEDCSLPEGAPLGFASNATTWLGLGLVGTATFVVASPHPWEHGPFRADNMPLRPDRKTLSLFPSSEFLSSAWPKREWNMNIADLKKLTKTERFQAMEALWDSLLYDNGEIDTPKWHVRILEERKNKILSGGAKFISLEELKASRRQ
jgi:hypothetical protein